MRPDAGDRRTKRTLVVSDVHLGALPRDTEQAFLDFLAFAAREAAALVVNGDLFDVSPVHADHAAPEHVDVLARIAEATRGGLQIAFVGGNRDPVEWSGPTLARVGVQVLGDPARTVVADRVTLIAHGDGARRGAAGPYRKPYPILRHPVVVGAVRDLLPAGLAHRIHRLLARRSPTRARAERASRGESTGPKRRAPGIEAWARSELAADPTLSLVIGGHSHLPALVEVAPGRYYVNAGDWVSHHTYAVVPPGHGPPEVRYWPSQTPVDWATLHDADVPASALALHAPGPARDAAHAR